MQGPVAKWGALVYFLRIGNPEIWSECEWVIKIPLILSRGTSIFFNDSTIRFREIPASISIASDLDSTRKQLPFDPEAIAWTLTESVANAIIVTS